MSNRIVRIYRGEPGASDVVGFSHGAYPQDPDILQTALTEWGYESNWLRSNPPDQDDGATDKATGASSAAERPHGSVSETHLEVRPPLTWQDTLGLGTLCTGRDGQGRPVILRVKGRRIQPIVDSGDNDTFAIDNRQQLPRGPLHAGGILISVG